ncbi:MAG TPA: NADPH:quinone oxidoreductase family protein [Acidimicrobiia bacterium]|nr:NADPH:quinone oxidoreductase family protein [Acidimicrobiia bacterium]
MRAARCLEYGPPESVVVEEVPDPVVERGQAVVRIEAAALNYPDVLIVANKYQVSVPPPFIPGSEYAGTVVAVGDDVTDVAPGDRVFGGGIVGAFAQMTSTPARALTRVPDAVTTVDAAAFGVVYRTAYHSLRSVADARRGDWVVVLGAAGGVGLAAVELAQVLGARVLAAASSPAKLDACRAAGAEATVDYDTEDLKERIKEITGGGADVVLDPVGGPYAEQALRATRWGGRFVTIGFASGEIPRIPLNLVLLKGVVVKGFEIRTFSEHAPEDARRDHEELDALFEAGKVHPHISAVYPLDRVADALTDLAERRAVGKVVLDPWA